MTRKYSKPKKVIFVCSGNTCRSPMAEYIFRDMTQKAQLDVSVSSRSIQGNQELFNEIEFGPMNVPKVDYDYYPKHNQIYGFQTYNLISIGKISLDAQKAILDYNPEIQNIDAHRARRLTMDELVSADIILTMERDHRNRILDAKKLYFDEKGVELPVKIYTLSEYAETPKIPDISDPLAFTGFYERPYSGYTYGELGTKEPKMEESGTAYPETTYHYVRDYRASNQGPDAKYIKCRDDIISYLKVLLEDIKNPAAMGKKMERLDINRKNEPPQEQTMRLPPYTGGIGFGSRYDVDYWYD